MSDNQIMKAKRSFGWLLACAILAGLMAAHASTVEAMVIDCVVLPVCELRG